MTKQKILEKALELFTEKGYEGSSMDDIAKAVGIRKASLYSHFSGKESIFAAIFENILAEYDALISKLMGGGQGAMERLGTIFMAYIRFCKHSLSMDFWNRYYYYPPEFHKDYIQKKTEETNSLFLDSITGIISEGVASGEILDRPSRKLALAYYYLLIGLSMSVKLYGEEELEREAADALDGFLAGILIKQGEQL